MALTVSFLFSPSSSPLLLALRAIALLSHTALISLSNTLPTLVLYWSQNVLSGALGSKGARWAQSSWGQPGLNPSPACSHTLSRDLSALERGTEVLSQPWQPLVLMSTSSAQ